MKSCSEAGGTKPAEHPQCGVWRAACGVVLRRVLRQIAYVMMLEALLPGLCFGERADGGAPDGPALRTPRSAPGAPEAEYVLGAEDQVSIAILAGTEYPDFAQPTVQTVRPDGKITLPRLGELTAAGKTAAQLQADVETALARLFRRPPPVTVAITGFRLPGVIYVWGEVTRPGGFPFRKGLGTVEALALAGGPLPQADLSRMTITRAADRSTVRTDLSRLGHGSASDGNPELQPGDVVRVPRLERRRVMILGGVQKPGPYDITEEISLFEALKLAEGTREKADLRAAVITRRDGTTVSVDLEQLARAGGASLNLKLGDGDTLLIPERLIRVYVAGEVARPDTLVLRDGATLVEALTECGWFARDADLKQVRLGRRGADGQLSVQTLDLSDLRSRSPRMQSVPLADGDFVLVLARGKKKKPEDYLPFIYPLDVLRRILIP